MNDALGLYSQFSICKVSDTFVGFDISWIFIAHTPIYFVTEIKGIRLALLKAQIFLCLFRFDVEMRLKVSCRNLDVYYRYDMHQCYGIYIQMYTWEDCSSLWIFSTKHSFFLVDFKGISSRNSW